MFVNPPTVVKLMEPELSEEFTFETAGVVAYGALEVY